MSLNIIRGQAIDKSSIPIHLTVPESETIPSLMLLLLIMMWSIVLSLIEVLPRPVSVMELSPLRWSLLAVSCGRIPTSTTTVILLLMLLLVVLVSIAILESSSLARKHILGLGGVVITIL